MPAPKCSVGDWGSWGDCKSPKGLCNTKQSHSLKMTDGQKKLGKGLNGCDVTIYMSRLILTHWHVVTGRMNMENMMKLKNDISQKRQTCLKEGTCPHLQPRPSQRFTECIDGSHTYCLRTTTSIWEYSSNSLKIYSLSCVLVLNILLPLKIHMFHV